MRFGVLIAAAAAFALTCGAADAQTTAPSGKKRVVRGDHTVVVSRDESGRTRTRIIVQRRSFLDPGTQVFPGEKRYNDGPALVYQPSFTSAHENTNGSRPTALPRGFDLPY